MIPEHCAKRGLWLKPMRWNLHQVRRSRIPGRPNPASQSAQGLGGGWGWGWWGHRLGRKGGPGEDCNELAVGVGKNTRGT